MGIRQEQSLQSRKKLLQAAKELIEQKGLAQTSVAEITQRAGLSCGSFYTYFKRKEDVLQELSQEMFAGILQQAKEQPGDFCSRLTWFMVHFAGYIEHSGLKMCQAWVRDNADPDLLQLPPEQHKLHYDLQITQELLASGVHTGELLPDTDLALLSHTVIDVLYGQMLCWDMSGGAYSFSARTAEFCQVFLPALLQPWLTQQDKAAQ